MDKQVANNYLEETLFLKQKLEKNFLELGQRLMKIRDEQLFLATHTSFFEFLGEAKMTESTASKMISIYSHYLLHLGVSAERVIASGGWTTAYKVKDLATTKEEAEDILDKAAIWSPKDLDIYLKEKKSGIIQAECQHLDTVDMRWCKVCNEKTRIYPDDN